MWDKNDQRFFIVQTAYYNAGNKDSIVTEQEQKKKVEESPLLINDLKFNEEWKGYEVNTFFCTSETGIKRQDSMKVDKDFEGLFGKININKFSSIIFKSPIFNI